MIEGDIVNRYVFWRLPNSKPHREQNDKYAQSNILAALGNAANTSGGGVQWPNFLTQRFQIALKSALIIIDPDGSELNETDAWNIVWSAIIELLQKTGGNKPIQSSILLREADKKAAEFFRKPNEKYVMVTSLSVKALPLTRLSIRESTLRALRDRGKRFPYPKAIATDHPQVVQSLEKHKGQHVIITTAGRSIHEASNNAMARLALVRGLWSLFGNYGSWPLFSAGTRKKRIGVVHAGPVHTLHYPDGTLVSDLFWYEPDYASQYSIFDPNEGWTEIEKLRRWAMRRLTILPYGQELGNVLIRYAAALDQVNLDIAFIHLWSILEKITDTVGGNYDETIRRTVWVYDEPQLAAEMLGAMRLHRNRLVHSAQTAMQQDQVAYMVKSFVEPHLIRLLRNDFDVSSFEEYGKQLSLPTNIEVLKKQHRRLSRAIQFMAQDSKK